MDFHFLAATMGSVVGEKITRTIELSTSKKWAGGHCLRFRWCTHV